MVTKKRTLIINVLERVLCSANMFVYNKPLTYRFGGCVCHVPVECFRGYIRSTKKVCKTDEKSLQEKHTFISFLLEYNHKCCFEAVAYARFQNVVYKGTKWSLVSRVFVCVLEFLTPRRNGFLIQKVKN